MKSGRGEVYRLAKFKVNSAKHFLMKSERVEMFQYIVDTLDYENIECWENKNNVSQYIKRALWSKIKVMLTVGKKTFSLLNFSVGIIPSLQRRAAPGARQGSGRCR